MQKQRKIPTTTSKRALERTRVNKRTRALLRTTRTRARKTPKITARMEINNRPPIRTPPQVNRRLQARSTRTTVRKPRLLSELLMRNKKMTIERKSKARNLPRTKSLKMTNRSTNPRSRSLWC
jgi:hypothetical protein